MCQPQRRAGRGSGWLAAESSVESRARPLGSLPRAAFRPRTQVRLPDEGEAGEGPAKCGGVSHSMES